MRELSTPPDREVNWVAWQTSRADDIDDARYVSAKTWFFAKAKAAALFGTTTDNVVVELARENE
jgi:hypothetical protein